MPYSGLSRRELLKRTYAAIVACGAAPFLSYRDLLAADRRPRTRPTVVWLHGTSCSGCSVSFLNVEEIPVPALLTRFVDLRFHPDLSLATGQQVLDLLDAVGSGGDKPILVFEGGVPVELPHACLVGGRPMTDWLKELLPRSSACIIAGTCAVFGGVAAIPGAPHPSRSLVDFIAQAGISVPYLSIPGCPLKPEHMVHALLHVAQTGRLPEADELHRPRAFFTETVHERCILYADFQEGLFAERIGDPGCLLHLGCQGPITYNDCVVRGYNGNINSCIRAGHPCLGCGSEHFPRLRIFQSFGEDVG